MFERVQHDSFLRLSWLLPRRCWSAGKTEQFIIIWVCTSSPVTMLPIERNAGVMTLLSGCLTRREREGGREGEWVRGSERERKKGRDGWMEREWELKIKRYDRTRQCWPSSQILSMPNPSDSLTLWQSLKMVKKNSILPNSLIWSFVPSPYYYCNTSCDKAECMYVYIFGTANAV